ncbi:hypothetical protein [Pseudomonas brassicacearum]|uniref:hypothetical protein n=1 Tax=Pseudomonas brassicacearum TaxID=930166 RepID=UPI001E025280|nr:hypothetical protein [Pseudomonas brassicacearum]CAH0289783.1 hypothetical protein SRABI06_04191 [Pseudomonas brassicacearum]
MSTKVTTGELRATGTSPSGFSTTDVSAQRNSSDKGYSFEGTNAKGEWLHFFVRTLDIKQGQSFAIEQYGGIGTAAAHYRDSDKNIYNGTSGVINFEIFDAENEKVEVRTSDLEMSKDSEVKKVEARGNS